MKRFKGSIIFIISVLIAFQNNINVISLAKESKDNPKNLEASKTQDLALLSKNSDWKKLSTFWKKMNNLKTELDIPQKIKQFQEISKQNESLLKSLDNLVQAKLINDKDKESLKILFSDRIRYLEFKSGVMKCYKMSQLGMTIVTKRDDLETRYDMLEKLFIDKKINSDTFKQTKAKIFEDLKFIDDNSGSSPELSKRAELLDLLINLNK